MTPSAPDRPDRPQAGQLASLLDRASAVDADPALADEARREVERLFVESQDRVYAVCARYLGHTERAREVAQDTFLTAYRRLAEYRGEGSFHSWLYGIARFKCLRAIEKKKDLLSGDGVVDAEDGTANALRLLRKAERDELVRQASLAVLDPLEQEAVYLRYTQGLGQDRITEILGLTTASGARGLLQRCRRKLSREIARLLEERGHGMSFFQDSMA